VVESLFDDLVLDPSSPVFVPVRSNVDLRYAGVLCRCGDSRFQVQGWPRLALGRGGFFWRSVTRVWREARLPIEHGEPTESPFLPPLFVRCMGCGHDAAVLDDPRVRDAMPSTARGEPKESLRCRSCRRGRFFLSAGFAEDPADVNRLDIEIVARCVACAGEGRIAWSHARPSEQEVRLDLLYGRR
jgi:hypothetical protein